MNNINESTLIKNTDKILVDINTTGLDKVNDEILQLSIMDANGKIIFDEYFKPERHERWLEAEIVNGISYDDVKDCKPFSDYVETIMDIFSKSKLIIGFNHIAFDLEFIKRDIEKLTNKPYTVFNEKKLYDVMLKYAYHFSDYDEDYGDYPWTSLALVYGHFGGWYRRYRPYEDLNATLHVYNELIKLYNE